MTGPPRDWDKEMAEIDKLIAKDSGVRAPGAGVKAQGAGAAAPAVRAEARPAPRGRAALATWAKVLLGAAAAAGVSLAWPYAHACGLSLYGYLAAAAGVFVAGVWGAVSGWQRRIGLAHLVGLLVALTGAGLIGKAILDRTDYSKNPLTWTCP